MAAEPQAGLSTTRIHEIYITATAEAIWDAITSPEWSRKYGYEGIAEYDLRPGGRFRMKGNELMRSMGLPETIIDGEVIEAHPPYKLVQTYRFLFSPEDAAEGFTRITFDIEDTGEGFCRVRITHELEGAPRMAANTSSTFNTRGP